MTIRKESVMLPMQVAEDFRAECRAIHSLLAGLPDDRFAQPTLFKGWTTNAVLQHLAFWNGMACKQLDDESGLLAVLGTFRGYPGGMRAFENDHFKGLGGQALLEVWRHSGERTADLFLDADPKRRLKWSGPDMSARSSITARLMETWAHAQAVYDHLGVIRRNGDGLRHIVALGANTYGWTFRNRGLEVPQPTPCLRLTLPSGEVLALGDDGQGERIAGPAEAFCQVVAQTRHIADVMLQVDGPNARAWMSMAQCFAGPPQDPPAPGSRGIHPA
jgi:uncharacterized protein (TIGR03084 family)